MLRRAAVRLDGGMTSEDRTDCRPALSSRGAFPSGANMCSWIHEDVRRTRSMNSRRELTGSGAGGMLDELAAESALGSGCAHADVDCSPGRETLSHFMADDHLHVLTLGSHPKEFNQLQFTTHGLAPRYLGIRELLPHRQPEPDERVCGPTPSKTVFMDAPGGPRTGTATQRTPVSLLPSLHDASRPQKCNVPTPGSCPATARLTWSWTHCKRSAVERVRAEEAPKCRD
ncbi:uncharacterized protein B0H18DRAFT_962977 [Fomitopsis serialis]|uniref:uncharacterized protein n=1 Tax=Fomitopsis serialis TaxID=139415 RepID=UPI002008D28F|nr:uncharacterized protein B0H18DRAFT_962977 [Neoantrodia serialis]KAH9910670.1 hypothetical protein B0H18DRAFT_962977 [Neoantrodia serialis]